MATVACLSWNSTRPTRTWTPTLGMCLSCNFVNVYTIAYNVHVYTRASLTDILARIFARKIARRVGQVGEDCRACPARGKLNGEVAGHADILATILTRKSARISVSVSVSVPWNSCFYNLATLSFDLLNSVSVRAKRLPWTIISPDFGVVSSSCFPFRARTYIHTDRRKGYV